MELIAESYHREREREKKRYESIIVLLNCQKTDGFITKQNLKNKSKAFNIVLVRENIIIKTIAICTIVELQGATVFVKVLWPSLE